jgi:hypothetical protein
MSTEVQVPFASQPSGPTGPNDAAYLARAEAAEAAKTETKAPEFSDQPKSFAAGKFKSVEDLEKAYVELQAKLGSTDKKDPAPKAEEAPKGLTTESFNSYVAEFMEKGQLSEDSYKSLEKMGVSKDLVDSYIEGRRSAAAAAENAVYGEVGGREQYQAMVSWAATALSGEEIEAYNEVINAGDPKKTLFAVRSLSARFKESNSSAPSRTVEGRRTAATDSFQSRAEMIAAMSDPRYSKDPAYRNSVVERLKNSKLD